jgi:hypothetical protein
MILPSKEDTEQTVSLNCLVDRKVEHRADFLLHA